MVETEKKTPADKAAARTPPPPAGPHARPDLTNYDATPGAGTLPRQNPEGPEADGLSS